MDREWVWGYVRTSIGYSTDGISGIDRTPVKWWKSTIKEAEGTAMKFTIDLDELRGKVEVDDDHKWGYELRLVNEPEYCGKLLVLESKESSSLHYHKEKKETFIVLSGDVKLTYYSSDDRGEYAVNIVLHIGSVITLLPLQKHQFRAINNTRARILEVSTHHEDSDTYRITD